MWKAPTPDGFLPECTLRGGDAWYHKSFGKTSVSRFEAFGSYQNARKRSPYCHGCSSTRLVGFHGNSDGEALQSHPARSAEAGLGIYRHGLAQYHGGRKKGRFCGRATPSSAPSAEHQLAKSFQARSSVWLERYLDTVEVNGSSPFGPTICFNNLPRYRGHFTLLCDVFCDIGPF